MVLLRRLFCSIGRVRINLGRDPLDLTFTRKHSFPTSPISFHVICNAWPLSTVFILWFLTTYMENFIFRVLGLHIESNFKIARSFGLIVTFFFFLTENYLCFHSLLILWRQELTLRNLLKCNLLVFLISFPTKISLALFAVGKASLTEITDGHFLGFWPISVPNTSCSLVLGSG